MSWMLANHKNKVSSSAWSLIAQAIWQQTDSACIDRCHSVVIITYASAVNCKVTLDGCFNRWATGLVCTFDGHWIPCAVIRRHSIVLLLQWITGGSRSMAWKGFQGGHDDVITWKHFPHYWPFRGIHRSPVNSPHKGQWRGALIFSLIYA